MALPLIALAVALVLVLLVAATAVLVKLVLWLSLSRTLLLLATASLYWFVTSRRRCLARGFYSCSQVPMEITMTEATMETETTTSDCSDQAAAGSEPAEAGAQMLKKKSQLDDVVAVNSSASVFEEAPALLHADVQVADQVAPDATVASVVDENADDAARAEVKVNLVRRRSMQLPAPLLGKMLGDASSPSLSATESEEDDEEEPTLTTRSFASRSTAASPMRAAAAVSPAPSSCRKIRPRSSSSSSGFSVANRKRLLGSPVRQPQLHSQPQSSTSSSSSSSAATTRHPHPNGMMTPVRNRRAATVTTNPSIGSSKSQSNMHSSSSGGLIKRNAFARRSTASERELMQEKMAADGYWIGDFRLERQLVARRSFLSKDGSNGSGNSSARSSPRAV